MWQWNGNTLNAELRIARNGGNNRMISPLTRVHWFFSPVQRSHQSHWNRICRIKRAVTQVSAIPSQNAVNIAFL